jgi:hypothetical protein
MTVLADLRPAGLDLLVRPGNTVTLTLDWPAGTLAGRTFTSTLDLVALAVLVVGDTMTVTADDVITGALDVGVPAPWLLLEDIDGTDEPVLVGTWVPSNGPAAIDAATLTVTAGAATVTVTSLGGVSVAQVAELLDRANHTGFPLSPIVHDWDVDGWTPWTPRRINPSDDATVTTSVAVPGRGRVTGHATATGGGMRQAYLRQGTEWANSRIKALWWGTNIYSAATAAPQMGLILRGQIDGDGEFIGVAITNNVFLSDPDVINCNLWFSDAAEDGFIQGDVLGQKTFNTPLNRSLALVSTMRFNFITWINSHSAVPNHLYGLAQGDLINISSGDATFNATAAPCTGANTISGSVSLDELTVGHQVAVALKTDTGLITPPVHKKFWPMWMVAELVGNNLRFKVWRYQDEEPDWSSAANVQTYDISASTTLDHPVGPGFCGVIAAHHRNSSYQEFGHLEFTQLP